MDSGVACRSASITCHGFGLRHSHSGGIQGAVLRQPDVPIPLPFFAATIQS